MTQKVSLPKAVKFKKSKYLSTKRTVLYQLDRLSQFQTKEALFVNYTASTEIQVMAKIASKEWTEIKKLLGAGLS